LVVEVSGHLDVPLDTPVSSPRVLDEPISTSAVNSPSDGEDSVVEGGGRASWLVVDSTGVQLEGVLRSIDGNRDGSEGNLGKEIALTSGLDVGEALESGTAVGSVVVAGGSIGGGVWVRDLSVDPSVGDNVGHGLSHETSLASLVSLGSGAIHQVLLRERVEFPGGEEVAPLSGTSGRERPARSALSLVLDWGDGTLGSPIPRSGSGVNVVGLVDLGDNDVGLGSEVDSGKLLAGEIGELVHANSEGLVELVVLSHEVQVRSEGSVSGLELVVVVRLLVGLHPEGEGILVLDLRDGQSSASEEKGNEGVGREAS